MASANTNEHCRETDTEPDTDVMYVLVLKHVVMLVDPAHSLQGCGWVLKTAFAMASKRNS